MATEQIPQIDKLFRDYGEKFRENARKANKMLEQVGEAIKKFQESEEKSMLHNVTVKHEENKALEEIWVMRAGKAGDSFGIARVVIDERELDHKPTPQEIAQFLSDSKADFASVVQNYRFAGELPF